VDKSSAAEREQLRLRKAAAPPIAAVSVASNIVEGSARSSKANIRWRRIDSNGYRAEKLWNWGQLGGQSVNLARSRTSAAVTTGRGRGDPGRVSVTWLLDVSALGARLVQSHEHHARVNAW
jgi:hypothetical protein